MEVEDDDDGGGGGTGQPSLHSRHYTARLPARGDVYMCRTCDKLRSPLPIIDSKLVRLITV